MDHDSGQVVNVLRRVHTLLLLLHGVGEHVQGNREVNMTMHLLGGGLVVLIALKRRSMLVLSGVHRISRYAPSTACTGN